MKNKNIIFITLTIINFCSLMAQFEGLGTYYEDTTLRALVKLNRVNAITETNLLYNSVSRYCFNKDGRVIETFNNSGHRMKFEYNAKGLVTKRISFDDKDTSKIEAWTSITFNDKGYLLKEENGNYQDGKLVVHTESETKVLSEEKDKTRMVTYKYLGDSVYETITGLDSTSGIYNYYITYTYRPEDIDEKGRKQGNKTVERTYVKNNCFYQDEITYKVNGRIEIADKIESYYTQTDAKGRTIASGKMNYENAYMAFMQKHPEDFNYYVFSPLFLKAVLTGTVKGEKEADSKYTYDVKGRLIEKDFYGSNYKFKYNEKNQITEQINGGNLNSTEQFWYNEKGLIIKTRNIQPANEAFGRSAQTQEYRYDFTYN